MHDTDADVDERSLPAYAGGFDAFYAAHYRRAVALARALTGSIGTAEEVVQDVMADAHRRWARIGTYDDPAQWLRRAVGNRAVSARRRAVVRARGLARLSARTSGASVDVDPADAAIWAAVRALPRRQAQLVALVYVEGLSLPEAATTLAIALPTAKTHLARARARLAVELAAHRPTTDDERN